MTEDVASRSHSLGNSTFGQRFCYNVESPELLEFPLPELLAHLAGRDAVVDHPGREMPGVTAEIHFQDVEPVAVLAAQNIDCLEGAMRESGIARPGEIEIAAVGVHDRIQLF